ncbi:hypothetical protein BGZ95_009597 [Linnemannia exigua]|uniref:Major facilitator superfamily (MFS) profile domain-containing protein n=1 Tax=Linnemannia exigua TaxID=604196 RepID=A0AAD4H6Z1_9FUNG|nr:hypothetical protein BGZ95_009597 [Linnemannia exigua]
MGSQPPTPSVHSDNATVVIESEKSHSNVEPSSSNTNNTTNNIGEKQEYVDTSSGGHKEEIIDEHDDNNGTSSKQKVEKEHAGVVAPSSASSSKGSSNHGNLDPGPHNPAHEDFVPLPFKQLMLVFTGLMLGIFLASLDQTIVSVCSTKIAGEFNALDQIPWIGTSYLLTSTTFQPLYGKGSDIFGRKATFLFSITVFLIGSALCGASQNMLMMIISRAIAGIGAGGIMAMVMIIITDLVSLRDRGKYQGIIGAVFGFSSVLGPLLGGVFFVNLPIGAITLAAVIKLLHLPRVKGSLREKLARIDFYGVIALIIGLVLLLLPLNWGGNDYEWSDPLIIGLLAGGVVVLGIFCIIEAKVAVEPILPFRLFNNRTNSAVFVTSFFVGMGFFGIMFFMPLYFQIVRQESATAAGLEMLPLIVGLLIASISSGFMVSKWGQYRPFIWVGLALSTIGTGLLTLLEEDSSRGMVIGFLFINGCGLGFSMQTIMLAIQSSVATADIAIATANATFFRTVGSVFGVAISGTVFSNAVKKNLAPLILVNPAIVNVVRDSYEAAKFDDETKALIFHAFMDALRKSFTVCIPFMGLAFLFSLLIQHNKLRKGLGPTPME